MISSGRSSVLSLPWRHLQLWLSLCALLDCTPIAVNGMDTLHATAIDQQLVFKAGENGTACIRTPILLRINDNVLLAFGGARYGSCSDYHGHSILLKRSEDNGISWSLPVVVTNITHDSTVTEHHDGINPGSAVFHPGTGQNDANGTVWFGWVECFHKCRVPYQFVKFSKDGGLSWSQPLDITKDIMALSKFAFGPGYGLWLPRYNRLLMCGHYLRTTEDTATGNGKRHYGNLDELILD